MLPWRTLMVGLFFSCIKTNAQSKTLFPAATRAKRGLSTETNLKFYNSTNDAHLLFEILMAGFKFESNGSFSVEDAELSTLQKTRSLDFICREIIPKNVKDVSRLIFNLWGHADALHQEDFERTLLTLVFTTQKILTSTDNHRELWGESFVGLYRAVKKDLTLTN